MGRSSVTVSFSTSPIGNLVTHWLTVHAARRPCRRPRHSRAGCRHATERAGRDPGLPRGPATKGYPTANSLGLGGTQHPYTQCRSMTAPFVRALLQCTSVEQFINETCQKPAGGPIFYEQEQWFLARITATNRAMHCVYVSLLYVPTYASRSSSSSRNSMLSSQNFRRSRPAPLGPQGGRGLRAQYALEPLQYR